MMSGSARSRGEHRGRTLLALVPVAFLALGCEVRTGRPDALWLLWLGPGLLLFYVYAFRTRARLLGRFASREMLPVLVAGVSRPRRRLKAFLVLVALLALAASLAQPRWGFVWEEVHREGVDIVVALDVSDSMLVRDAEAGGELSRLERAKREIADLLRRLEGDRIALVAFAGAAFLELPLTLDYSAAALFLEAMAPDLIPTKGTAIGEALRVSLDAFDRVASVGSRQSRAVILITDGEDHLGEAQEVAEAAAAAGVRVFAIGIVARRGRAHSQGGRRFPHRPQGRDHPQPAGRGGATADRPHHRRPLRPLGDRRRGPGADLRPGHQGTATRPGNSTPAVASAGRSASSGCWSSRWSR